ncbi:hypothetical protein QE152_g19591 [Popillia japonica]|uniref:Uncharacterized protein n=1 Tax=Popillia japonica TaxID=7064 RepID=A0AAW1KR09_POPJA
MTGQILQSTGLNSIIRGCNTNSMYYDMHSREGKDLEKGDNVTVLNRQKQWEPAHIVNKHYTPRSYLVKTENDNVLRRNRSHIRYSENLPTLKPNVSESSLVKPNVKNSSKDNSYKELDIGGNGTKKRAIATSKPQRNIKLPE